MSVPSVLPQLVERLPFYRDQNSSYHLRLLLAQIAHVSLAASHSLLNMHAAVLAARRVAGRRTPALSIARVQARSYAAPVPYAKEDDDPQLADYPRLPAVSKQTRPARGWEDMQMRRNFGEPVRKSKTLI